MKRVAIFLGIVGVFGTAILGLALANPWVYFGAVGIPVSFLLWHIAGLLAE